MVRAVITLWISILRSCAAFFRTREEQAIVELALRQQLAIYARRQPSVDTQNRPTIDA